jgi:hypothetical protein
MELGPVRETAGNPPADLNLQGGASLFSGRKPIGFPGIKNMSKESCPERFTSGCTPVPESDTCEGFLPEMITRRLNGTSPDVDLR